MRVARDLGAVTTIGAEDDPTAVGVSRGAVEAVWAAAVDLYRTGAHPAVQLTLRRDGRVVLDRSIGHARGRGPDDPPDAPAEVVTPDTPFCAYSASKAWTATVAVLLAERGAFRLTDRVARFVPEYAAHGKGATTIADVLGHRAGIPFLPRAAADLDRLDDHAFVRAQLSALRPSFAPGRSLAYHALTGGHVVAEVVRVTTGRTIREVLADEVLRPLGFRWSNYGVDPADLPLVGRTELTGYPLPRPLSALVSRALSGPLPLAVDKANDPRFLTATVPSANVVTTAREMSRFYELLRRGGELDGVRVLQERTVRDAVRPTTRPWERDAVLGWLPLGYGTGYMLGAKRVSLFGQGTPGAFGHLGLFNVVGWADPRRGLAAGLMTTGKGLVYPGVDRFLRLLNRISARIPADR